ncbi:MAG: hypothetical protein CFE31_07055 [Rhizobiales bacterium PAR1]|nr:MAG: hypothetical protein CFE31_07055 [Rhizobiales bacterium PAR1]
MAYLLSTFWFWCLLALVLGLVVGAMTCRRDLEINWRTFMPWLIAIGIGGLVSVVKLLPDRVGYWFDLGMLMLVAYFIGCCIPCLWRKYSASEAAGAASTPTSATASLAATRIEPVMSAPVAAAARDVPVEPAAKGSGPDTSDPVEEAVTGLSGPRAGKADDLTRIYGVDPETQAKLNSLGIYHYDQIASLTPGNRRWLFRQLGYEGRFPSWWWRWRYDAEKLAGAGTGAPVMAAAPGTVSTTSATATPLNEEGFEGAKPSVLAAPRGGKADDLKRIRGIGKQNEGRLHGLGVWHFDQIAAWTPDEVKWVGGYLAFPGRIEREDWQAQAKVLASGADTEFSKRADAGKVATSKDDTGDDGQKNVAVLGKDFGDQKPTEKKPRPKK